MKLSEIKTKNLSDEEIQKIVYSDIDDSRKNSTYEIVFGNSMLIKERIRTAVKSYKNGRISKVIFCGESSGISNQNSDVIAEAVKMRKLAIEMGIKEGDILIDDKSNNSFENINNAFQLINEEKILLQLLQVNFILKDVCRLLKRTFPI